MREREVVQAVHTALAEHQGNILVFLPGAPEIRRCEGFFKETGLGQDIIVAPLYGMLSRQAQDRAIEPPPAGMRKVVLASALAETSLTIEGVNVVIDSGFMRVPRFDPRSALTRLETVRVSRASADQRRGRPGEPRRGFATACGGQRKTPCWRRSTNPRSAPRIWPLWPWSWPSGE